MRTVRKSGDDLPVIFVSSVTLDASLQRPADVSVSRFEVVALSG